MGFQTYAEWLFTSKPEIFGLIPGWANPTGMALCLVALLMALGALPQVRRKGLFEVFYWTHMLYVAFAVLVILHCDTAWMFLVAPLSLFFFGKLAMVYRWMEGTGQTHVVSGVLLPSAVTELVVRRKPEFHFQAGDWVFINLPVISRFEWHAFTIS